MRGTMDGYVAAERQLNAIKDLLEVLPRSRGFRVSVDGSVSVYPATQRASLLRSRKAPSNPSVHRARSRGASVLRLTHAPAAALHARRSTAPKGVSRRYFACSSSSGR